MKKDEKLDPRVWIVDVICPKCGKKFVPAPYHAYKDKFGYYCSWSCFNHRKDKNKGEEK